METTTNHATGITSQCLDVTDKACVDVCPVQCIYELSDCLDCLEPDESG